MAEGRGEVSFRPAPVCQRPGIALSAAPDALWYVEGVTGVREEPMSHSAVTHLLYHVRRLAGVAAPDDHLLAD